MIRTANRERENITFQGDMKMETKIRQLDKPTVKYITKRLQAVLTPLAKELGVMIDLGSCTFQTSNCRIQLKVAVLNPDGEPVTEEADAFKRSAKLFGFEPADLGKEFASQGQTYTINGLRPKSRKYPVIARAGNGKDYKFACRTVLKALGRKVPVWL
jgi:hypothetical protein